MTLGEFEPEAWQADVLRTALAGGGRPMGWAGGRGSGKSLLLCVLAVMLAVTRPGAVIGLAMDTARRLEDLHLPMMTALAESTGGVWRASASEFRWASGSVVRLRHLDTHVDPRHGRSPFEGIEYHAILVDEGQQVDPRYWAVFIQRARKPVTDLAGVLRPAFVAVSGLPVNEWWIAEVLRMGGKTWRPRTKDNRHLPASYEADMRATMTERMARSMIDGEVYAPEGQIVEEFVPSLEVPGSPGEGGSLTDWVPDWEQARTLLAMDLGANNPHALLAAEDVQRGRWVIMREWYRVGRKISPDGTVTTLGQFAGLINRDTVLRKDWRRGDNRIPIDEVVADPAGAAVNAQSGHSDLEMLAGARPDGLGIRPLVETIPERRSVMGSLNRLRLAIERRRLMFSRAMIEAGQRESTGRSLAKSLAGYRWDPRGRDEPLKDDVHDHAVDALRYGCRRVLWHIIEAEPTPARPATVHRAPEALGHARRER